MSTTINPYFTSFNVSIDAYALPERFTYPFQYVPHPLSLLAAKQLQEYLDTQTVWSHNFGLNKAEDHTTVIGKMFGVLVVETAQKEIGFLSAFSGKLAGGNQHAAFVPPVFDLLAPTGFLNAGMQQLSKMNTVIEALEQTLEQEYVMQLQQLKVQRKAFSIELQNKIFDQYFFLNQAGEEKSLRAIFKTRSDNNPPSGAGECAAPKLLQYAFQHQMKPLALAEFWWGLSPKSDHWKHGHFYPCCNEKCEPILEHMLAGMLLDENRTE